MIQLSLIHSLRVLKIVLKGTAKKLVGPFFYYIFSAQKINASIDVYFQKGVILHRHQDI